MKKLKETTIKKSIAKLFRNHNIIEYKAHDDYLSINDFYKVYGYACIYQSDTDRVKEVDPETLTLTFVCSHYPREMLKHLKQVRGIHVKRLCGSNEFDCTCELEANGGGKENV